MSDDKELPVFITECEEENARLKQRIAELEAYVEQLRVAALEVVAWGVEKENIDWTEYAIDAIALDGVLSKTPATSLAAVRREAMEKERVQLINVVKNFWNIVDDSSPEDMVKVMRDTKFYD